MKKKISIFATLALCATIGGVYATWTYAQNAAKEATYIIDTNNKTLADAGFVEKGTLTVDNSLQLTVDKAENSYDAVLSITGELNVTFDKHDLSTEDTIVLQYQVTATNLKYNETDIFVLPTQAIVLNNGNKANTWTIKAENLASEIKMGAINLSTYAEYEAFTEAFDACTLTITFSEVTA